MKRPPLARLLTAVAVAVVAAGVVAASMSAAAVKSEVTVPGAGFASVGTDCPRGTGLVSQGFGSKGFTVNGTGSTVVRIDSHRSGTGLASSAQNFSSAEEGVFDAYAYCSKAASGIKVVRDKEFVVAGTFGAASATCPRGAVPVGGGFGAPGFAGGSAQVITLTSRRQGRSWRVEAISEGGSAARGTVAVSGKLIAYAYCMKNAPKITVRKQSVAVDQASLKAAVATCPKGWKAVSGGFDGNIRLSGTPHASGVVVSRRARRGRAWKGRAISVNETGGAKATVYAYCMKS